MKDFNLREEVGELGEDGERDGVGSEDLEEGESEGEVVDLVRAREGEVG